MRDIECSILVLIQISLVGPIRVASGRWVSAVVRILGIITPTNLLEALVDFERTGAQGVYRAPLTLAHFDSQLSSHGIKELPRERNSKQRRRALDGTRAAMAGNSYFRTGSCIFYDIIITGTTKPIDTDPMLVHRIDIFQFMRDGR